MPEELEVAFMKGTSALDEFVSNQLDRHQISRDFGRKSRILLKSKIGHPDMSSVSFGYPSQLLLILCQSLTENSPQNYLFWTIPMFSPRNR